jgi:2-dehydro-3-deoxygluconokinase
MNNIFPGINNGAVLAFGELLLRICPDADGQWLNNNTLPFYVAGAELNAATALALWGLPVKYLTALPKNNMSAELVSYLKRKGIDTSPIVYQGSRIGLFYLTKGSELKHDALIYDRAYSAFSELKRGMIDWDEVLRGASWFHFSAICPAISQDIADVCQEALEAAARKNITISVDLNYRAKLWQYGKTPYEVMPVLMQYCNVIMGNIWAVEKMLGIPVGADIHTIGTKEVYLQEALKVSEQIAERYPACKAVANTFRFDATGEIRYYASLYNGGTFYHSKEYEAAQIVDKVGSGDCFMAGLIYGFYKERDAAATLEFATAAAFQKLFVEGDTTNKTVAEIKKTIKL